MKKQNYHNKKSEKLKVLEELQSGKAPQKTLNDLYKTIMYHINNHSCGSLYNFGGAYGRRVVELLRENYPDLYYMLDMESNNKKLSILDSYCDIITKNQRCNIAPLGMKTIIDEFTIEDNKEQGQSFTIVTGYPVIQNGNIINPERKF